MKKNLLITCFLLSISCLLFTHGVYASDYVLPYPSYMPGHKLYTLSTWWDDMGLYWNFGDIAGIKYERALSDKYMVEAKTLFDFGQYKLAVDALAKSDLHFAQAIVHAIEIGYKQKDDGTQKKILQNQAEKHKEVLDSLSGSLPDTITWDTEQTGSEELSISLIINKSKILRGYAYR